MGSVAAIADRYARAILELGVEAGTLSSLADEVNRFASAYEAGVDLRAVIENPLVPPEQRDAVLEEVTSRLGMARLAKNTVGYLAHRRRLSLLPDIARRLTSLSDDKAGVMRAVVTSAAPLPESFYSRLAQDLGALVGRTIVFDRQQDPSLIGGVITRVGDNIIDGSLRGRLDQLERQMLS
jgi:F-type H+-transporting ATPase subunit delta